MATIWGPNIVTDELSLYLDAANGESYAPAGTIPPKSESIAGSWDDYGSNQANYTVVGDDGVIITGNGWVGRFISQIPGGGGYFTVAFEYQSSSTATFLIDNDGSNNNIFNQSGIVATTTKQIFTKTANCTVGGAEDRMYINKSSGSGSLIITNYRFYKSDSAGNSLDWYDLCGLQNVISPFNGDPTYDPNTASGVFDLDGTGDNFVLSNQTAHITAKTWGIWLKFGSIPASNTFDSIFSKTANWNVATGISLQMIYGLLRWSWGENWGGSAYVSLSTLSTGTWYYVVGTSSGSVTSLYINGDLKDTGAPVVTPSDGSPLYIGTGSGGTMTGSISRFEIYSIELTAAQVLQNFNAQKGRYGL